MWWQFPRCETLRIWNNMKASWERWDQSWSWKEGFCREVMLDRNDLITPAPSVLKSLGLASRIGLTSNYKVLCPRLCLPSHGSFSEFIGSDYLGSNFWQDGLVGKSRHSDRMWSSPSGLAAVDHINTVLREGDPENTLLALQKPEAQLPTVYPFAAPMYQNELFNLQKQNAMVSQRRLRLRRR